MGRCTMWIFAPFEILVEDPVPIAILRPPLQQSIGARLKASVPWYCGPSPFDMPAEVSFLPKGAHKLWPAA